MGKISIYLQLLHASRLTCPRALGCNLSFWKKVVDVECGNRRKLLYMICFREM